MPPLKERKHLQMQLIGIRIFIFQYGVGGPKGRGWFIKKSVAAAVDSLWPFSRSRSFTRSQDDRKNRMELFAFAAKCGMVTI